MKREFLEVREMDFAPVGRIQIRTLRSLQRPLHDRVRNAETFSKRPVGPSPIVGEQPAEDIDVGFLDHVQGVSNINTRYNKAPSATVTGPRIVHHVTGALSSISYAFALPDMAAPPEGWGETLTGEPMPNVAADHSPLAEIALDHE